MSRAVARALILAFAMSGCGIERDLGSRDASDAGDAGKPAAPGACPAGCRANEVCHRGACIARSPGGEPCEEVPFGTDDGCAPDAVCIARGADAGARCVPFPPCAADDTCPVGAIGSTCNISYLPAKARICLAGQCVVPTECPASQRCLKTMGEVGLCSAGDPGSPCVVTADCKNTHCFTSGAFGLCF